MTAPATVAEVDRALRLAHGGGIEEIAPGVMRFTGMCTACPCRPNCWEATVRPALGDGVTLAGPRLSPAARERLERALHGG